MQAHPRYRPAPPLRPSRRIDANHDPVRLRPAGAELARNLHHVQRLGRAHRIFRALRAGLPHFENRRARERAKHLQARCAAPPGRPVNSRSAPAASHPLISARPPNPTVPRSWQPRTRFSFRVSRVRRPRGRSSGRGAREQDGHGGKYGGPRASARAGAGTINERHAQCAASTPAYRTVCVWAHGVQVDLRKP